MKFNRLNFKKSSSLKEKHAKAGYFFTLPIILGIVLIYIPVIMRSVIFSFSSMSITKEGYSIEFAGVDNYIKAFLTDTVFLRTSLTSIRVMFIDLLFIIIFSFFIASILNQSFKGRTVARIIFFLPVIMATGVINVMESGDLLLDMFQSGVGGIDSGTVSSFQLTDLRTVLLETSVNPGMIELIINAIDGLYSIVISSGVQILIFLAGLQAVPPALYEASYVEGCTGWESFWKITLPIVSPVIVVNVLYTIINSLTHPLNPTMEYIVNTAIRSNDHTFSSAMAWIYFLVVGVIMVIIVGVVNKLVFYEN